jgi:hypothetical protein
MDWLNVLSMLEWRWGWKLAMVGPQRIIVQDIDPARLQGFDVLSGSPSVVGHKEKMPGIELSGGVV